MNNSRLMTTVPRDWTERLVHLLWTPSVPWQIGIVVSKPVQLIRLIDDGRVAVGSN
jgi:hypothetical protein